RLMACLLDRIPQVARPGGGIAVPGGRVIVTIWLPAAVRAAGGTGAAVRGRAGLPAVFPVGPGGQELLRDGGVGVLLARGLGQLLIGDDPGLRVRRDMRPVAVPAGLR